MATARISNVRYLTDGGAVAEAPEFAAKITVSPNIDERSGIKPRWNIRIENTSTNTTREFTDYAWDFEGAINLAVSSLSKNAAASSSSAAAKPPTSAPLRAGEVLDRALERQATGTRSQADASLIEKLRAEGYTEDQIQRALAALNNPTPPPLPAKPSEGLARLLHGIRRRLGRHHNPNQRARKMSLSGNDKPNHAKLSNPTQRTSVSRCRAITPIVLER